MKLEEQRGGLMISELATRAFSLLGMQFGIISNVPELINDNEYFGWEGKHLHSLLTNFGAFTEIPFSNNHQNYFVLIDDVNLPLSVTEGNNSIHFSGPLSVLEHECKDKRITFFGNMGLFSKFLVKSLENYGMYSFHSTSFFDPDNEHLFLVLGGSGVGKSAVLLSAIERGYQVFGTELTHVSVQEGNLRFYRGSLYQNCRVGNLVEDFPSLIDRFAINGLPETNIWHEYISIDLTSVAAASEILTDPSLTIIFPRIEGDRKIPKRRILGTEKLPQAVFENLSEKIAPPSYLYGSHFHPSVDSVESAQRRSDFSQRMIEHANIKAVWESLASPKMCLDEIAEDKRRKV